MASDKDERVLVNVRVRPLTDQEEGRQIVVSCKDRTLSLAKDDKGTMQRQFTFDRVYWSVDKNGELFHSQQDIYEDIGRLMLHHAFAGFNTCIFAYGQTSSGKTYTMMGDHTSHDDTYRGIIPRACSELFEMIDQNFTKVELGDDDERPAIQSYEVYSSYYEIYNEKVYDLLEPNKDELRVREHPTSGPFVENLEQRQVSVYDEVLQLLLQGNRHRHTNSTKLNDRSSRSHAIFSVVLKQSVFREGELSEFISRINLVDLAGSERCKAAGTTGDAFVEGVNINRSLCTLGQVIHNLAENNERHRDTYINFRDSNLTWLLRENLGGNSKTIMVATISPSSSCYEESMNTLRYADRVKQIRQRAVVNEDSKTKLIRDLRQEVAVLRKENMEVAKLRHELLLLKKNAVANAPTAKTNDTSDIIMVKDDSPYLVVLSPNPTVRKPLLLRLTGGVVLLTDPTDTASLDQASLRTQSYDTGKVAQMIKVPGMPRSAAVIVRGSQGSVFGTRPCVLKPMATNCRILKSPRTSSSSPSVGLSLLNGCIVRIGEVTMRYSDPSAIESDDDPFLTMEHGVVKADRLVQTDDIALDGSLEGRSESPMNMWDRMRSGVAPLLYGLAPDTAKSTGSAPPDTAKSTGSAPPDTAKTTSSTTSVSVGVGESGLLPPLDMLALDRRQVSPSLISTDTSVGPRSQDASSRLGTSRSSACVDQAKLLLSALEADGDPVRCAQLAELRRITHDMEEMLVTQKRENEELREETERYVEEVSLLRVQVEEQATTVQSARQEAKKDHDLMEMQVVEAQKEAEARDALVENMRQQLYEQRESYERKLQELEESREAVLRDVAEQHSSRTQELEEGVHLLQLQLQQAEEQLEKTQEDNAATIADLRGKSNALQISLSEAKETIEDRELEIEFLGKQKMQLVDTLADTQALASKLMSDVTKMREDMMAVQQDKEVTQQQKERLEQEVTRFREIEAEMQNAIRSLQEKQKKADEELTARVTEIRGVRQEKRRLQQDLEEREKKTKEKLAERAAELKYLKQIAEEKDLSRKAAEERCSVLDAKVRGTEEELMRLQDEIRERETYIQEKEQLLMDMDRKNLTIQAQIKESEEQQRAREAVLEEQRVQINELSKQLAVIQQKARDVQEKNRELYIVQDRNKERRMKLQLELETKEQELKETKAKYMEVHQRLQASIRKGLKEQKQLEQLRRLTSVVKEQEARIAFLQKELKDSQALTRRLEETNAQRHSAEEVQAVKEDFQSVIRVLKAEVIQFTPQALRQIQTIANSVVHATDPRRIFRQAFNTIRLVVSELSTDHLNSSRGGKWNVNESQLAGIKAFQRASVLKALREIVVWHGMSSDYTRQEMAAYVELSANTQTLLTLARISQNPNLPTLPTKTVTPVPLSNNSADMALRNLVIAGRRSVSSTMHHRIPAHAVSLLQPSTKEENSPQEKCSTPVEKDPLASSLKESKASDPVPSPTRHRSFSSIEPGMYCNEAEQERRALAVTSAASRRHILNLSLFGSPSNDRGSRKAFPSRHSSSFRSKSPGPVATQPKSPRTSLGMSIGSPTDYVRSRSGTPGTENNDDVHAYSDGEMEPRRKKEYDPKKKPFMQATFSSQSKEVAQKNGFALAAHMAQARRTHKSNHRTQTSLGLRPF